MVLVDKNIKKLAQSGQLISEGYNEDHVSSISYDLTIDCIYADPDSSDSSKSFELEPGCAVFIKTVEKLNIPKNIMGRIAEKNSRMRQGLKVDGPHYHPGHETYAFLRVQNISSKIIILKSKTSIAQIIFEQLTEVPDTTYDQQPGASFNNEVSYRGLGNYKDEYEKETIAKIDKAKEDLDSVSNRIYANVLTIMGVLVAVFSLITINHNTISASSDIKDIVIANVALSLCIVLLLGLIFLFINHSRSKKFTIIYSIIFAILAIAVILICI